MYINFKQGQKPLVAKNSFSNGTDMNNCLLYMYFKPSNKINVLSFLICQDFKMCYAMQDNHMNISSKTKIENKTCFCFVIWGVTDNLLTEWVVWIAWVAVREKE